MKPTTSILTYLKNPSAVELFGIAAGGTKVVFCSPSWVNGKLPGVTDALVSGTLEAYDLGGTKINPQVALGMILDLFGEATTMQRAVESAGSALAQTAVRVAWNLGIAPLVIAAVRADMIATGLASTGTSASAVLAKLQGVCTLVGLGMFAEAAATVQAVVPDGYLTTARLSLYAQMLTSADAIS